MNGVAESRAAVIGRAAAPVAVATTVATCLAAILLRFPPEQYSFYPQCPVHALLHIQCPGCGTTRALAALLRGHVAEAFRLNALTMSMLPLAVGYAAVWYRLYLRDEAFRWPQIPTAGIYAALAVAALFAALRNLPFAL